MSWALLSFGNTELMLNEGGRPSTDYRREVDLYIHVEEGIELDEVSFILRGVDGSGADCGGKT